jgi:hypothetical protein
MSFRQIINVSFSVLALVISGETQAQDKTYDEIATSLSLRLANAGHLVAEGGFLAFKKEDCEKIIPTFGTCFANNPAAPYTIATPPRASGEYIDPFYGDFAGLIEKPLQGTYRLDSKEALVVIGKTPPAAAYFGFQSYLFTRLNTQVIRRVIDDSFSGLLETLFGSSPNPERFYQFAAISDSFNDKWLARSIGKSSAWGEQFAVITTANLKTAEMVMTQLIATGMAAERIYVKKIPSQVSLGLGRFSDDLNSLIRYSVPQSQSAADAWLANPTLRLLRVTPVRTTLVRYGEFVPEERSANNESHLKPGLQEVSDKIAGKINLTNRQSASLLPVSVIGVQGPNCIKNRMNCLGDTFDTDTYRAGGFNPLGRNDVWIVTGVNHTLTGNATYISLGLNNQDTDTGIQSESQTGPAAGFIRGNLNGSIERVLGGDASGLSDAARTNLQKYYVRLFSRDCSGLPECTVVADDLPLDATAVILQRAYIKPGTVRSADPDLLVSPVLVQGQR